MAVTQKVAQFFKTHAVVVVGVCILVGVVIWAVVRQPGDTRLPLADARLKDDRQVVRLQAGDQTIQVEVVTEPASIELGLSGRSEIGQQGMLFIFQRQLVPSFWMKEMQFDLDLVWIDGSQVIGITDRVPAPSPETPLDQLPLYRPPAPVSAVLEVPAGDAARFGLQVGTELFVLQ